MCELLSLSDWSIQWLMKEQAGRNPRTPHPTLPPKKENKIKIQILRGAHSPNQPINPLDRRSRKQTGTRGRRRSGSSVLGLARPSVRPSVGRPSSPAPSFCAPHWRRALMGSVSAASMALSPSGPFWVLSAPCRETTTRRRSLSATDG